MDLVKTISAGKIRDALEYDLLIPAIEIALSSFSAGDGSVVQPMRSVVPIDKYNGILCVMPCFTTIHGSLATKLVTVYPENKDFPSHQAVILLYSPTDGHLMAMLDGDVVTEMRTAAASAVSAKYLARPNSSVLCILGAGVQGSSHIQAISSILPITEIRIYSRTFASAQKLAEKVTNGRACSSAEEAVRGADVIAVTLFTDTPVLFCDWVTSGAHIISIGAIGNLKQEIDPVLMRSSVIYADSRESALKETGDVTLAQAEIYAEIGEVIMGQKEAKVQETTVFKSLGLACEDAVSAKLVWDKLETPQSLL